MPDFEKKMRLQLYDADMNQMSDRLVDQDRETYGGPKEVHEGPMKIELCLFSKEDVDTFKEYLDMLRGNIPIKTHKKTRGRKKGSTKTSIGFREEIAEFLQNEELTDMSEAIKYLREEGFIFTSIGYLQDFGIPVKVSEYHAKKFRFMINLIKKAKNPRNDKYDPSILIGIKDTKMVVYFGPEVAFDKQFKNTDGVVIKIPPKAKVRFPKYVTHDERLKFRTEMGLLKDDKEKVPSKFYKRWVHEVQKSSPEGIAFPHIDIIEDPYK